MCDQSTALIPQRPRAQAVEPALDRYRLSVVAPAFNEADNLATLASRVRFALDRWVDWELILVDDGSTDETRPTIEGLAKEDPRIRGLFLDRNRGQSHATLAGAAAARGELIATIDADLQNNPLDLRQMVEALGDFDAVVGYRVERRDTWFKRACSKVANAVRNRVSGDSIRDTGCALKLFRAECLRTMPRFDGVHRFLPTIARYQGYRVLEVPVSHHPRIAGVSKYGFRNRALRATLDLIAVRWLRSRIFRLDAQPESSR
jgi:dolichol-phosphate mannosyltransferase